MIYGANTSSSQDEPNSMFNANEYIRLQKNQPNIYIYVFFNFCISFRNLNADFK